MQLIYNLYEGLPGLFLVNALIVRQDGTGALTHIVQKIGAHQLNDMETDRPDLHRRLLRLMDQVQPKTLEQYFNRNNKKPLSLAVLCQDEVLKKQVEAYVHRRVDELLEIASRNKIPLTWDAERRSLVKDMLLEPVETPLQPLLSFVRLPEGISYRLRLADANGPWRIHDRTVVPVTNNPAWVIVDYRLYRIAHINGYMTLPFQKKTEVRIPQSSVKKYFQGFILKVAAKADIEAEGFEVVQHNQLSGCRIEAAHDLFADSWSLVVYMEYPGAEFPCNDRRQERTALKFNTGNDIRIVKVRRDPKQEALFLEKLHALGLRPSNGSHFVHADPQDDDPLFLLQWLCDHRRALEAAGFTVIAPETAQGQLYVQEASIVFHIEQGNDWFDLHGEIRVGEHIFSFAALAPYIREGNRFFPLPGGAVFLIPAEWMSKYKALTQMGKKHGDGLRFTKGQKPLLQGIGGLEPSTAPSKEETTEVLVPALLKAELRPYQLEGFRWLVQLHRDGLGGCLADDMGLGKTLQTIAALLHAKAQKPATAAGSAQLTLFAPAADADFLQPLHALIVLPASLVFNWQNELRQFAPSLNVYAHTGPGRYKDIRLLARFDVVLSTYQTALRDAALLSKLEWEYIVLDESQQIKNKDSKVFKALHDLPARHKLSLSGTPIENSLSDLWSQMQFINPELLNSFASFKKLFILPIEKQQDEVQKASLRTLVEPYLLRRTKEEVAKDLPPLSTRIFYSEMTPEQEKLYEREKSKARNFLLESYRSGDGQYQVVVHQTLMRLRQIVNHPRMVIADYEKDSGKFRDVLEEWEVIRRSGHKVLLFSSFVKYLDLFRQEWQAENRSFAWLTGEMTAKQRQAEISRFQSDPDVQAFLISIKAGGTGLNLTAADYVFVLDPWWNPFVENQAVARAHRIGQDKNVIALKFITRGSIEEKILLLQERKKQLAEDIISNPEKLTLERSDLEFLLE